jgi:hypothetical protein
MKTVSTTISIALFASGLGFAQIVDLAVASSPQWTHSGPVPRSFHSAVFDFHTDRMILFRGISSTGVDLNDVFWLSNTGSVTGTNNLSWVDASPLGTPPAGRGGQTSIYDPGSNRMIVFGGGLGLASPCVNDVWALENANGFGRTPTWVQLNPSGTPPARRLKHSAVYDQSTDTMIIFGGNDCLEGLFGDVWILQHANGLGATPTWVQLAPTGIAPSARELTSAVYDAAHNRMIAYGGSADNSVWVLTNANGRGGTPAWVQVSPSGPLPPARSAHSAIYDAVHNIMTIFGGNGAVACCSTFNDVWALSNANGLGSPAWRQLNPGSSVGPAARAYHSAVYNSTTNAMTIYGGLDSTKTVAFQDVWVINHANGL